MKLLARFLDPPAQMGQPCPLCGASRLLLEEQIAECDTCGRDTWEDQGGVNGLDVWRQQIQSNLAEGKPFPAPPADTVDKRRWRV